MKRREPAEATCSTCDSTFQYLSPLAPSCCSDSCKKEYVNAYHRARRCTVEGTLRAVVAGCRNRARRQNKECDIDYKYMLDIYNKQNGMCAGTGRLLKPSAQKSHGERDTDTVSVDRIDSSRGYTKDNVQLVTLMYNTCKSNFTHDQVVQFCKDVICNEEKL